MKVLVTGGAGFIGSHIVDANIENGHQVEIIDDMSSGKMENVHPKAKLHKLDICSPEAAQIIREGNFNAVFHLAAQIDVRKSVEDPIYDLNINVVGSLNLIKAASLSGVRKFIFSSTGGAIYGEQDFYPADESHPTRPLSPYGITKMTTENYLRFYFDIYKLPYVCLRYANVYGPRQNPHGEAGVVAIFAARLLKNQQPIINGDGKQTRDFVFVKDVARANMLALQYQGIGTFNVGTGIETDVNEVYTHLQMALNPAMGPKHGVGKAGEQMRSVISYGLIEKVLGWRPEVNVADGLAETAKFFKERIK